MQSVFSGGSKKARLRARKYNYEAYLENCHKIILQSFKEVDDMNARKRLLEDNLSLTKSKYEQGLLTDFDINSVKLSLITVSKQNQNTKLVCFIDYLSIIKSLGGGF